MQMTSKLEETKRKAAIINKTKRRLGGPEQEFKAGDGELRRGPGGGRKLGTPRKKPNPRCVFRLPANLPSSPRDEIKTGPQKVAARERRGRGGGEDHLTTSRSLTLQPRQATVSAPSGSALTSPDRSIYRGITTTQLIKSLKICPLEKEAQV